MYDLEISKGYLVRILSTNQERRVSETVTDWERSPIPFTLRRDLASIMNKVVVVATVPPQPAVQVRARQGKAESGSE